MKNVTCDRCQSRTHTLSGSELILRPGETTSTEVYDLCRGCLSWLRKFLANEPVVTYGQDDPKPNRQVRR